MGEHADDAPDIACGVGVTGYMPEDMGWQLSRKKRWKWQGILNGLWQIQHHGRMGEHGCALDP